MGGRICEVQRKESATETGIIWYMCWHFSLRWPGYSESQRAVRFWQRKKRVHRREASRLSARLRGWNCLCTVWQSMRSQAVLHWRNNSGSIRSHWSRRTRRAGKGQRMHWRTISDVMESQQMQCWHQVRTGKYVLQSLDRQQSSRKMARHRFMSRRQHWSHCRRIHRELPRERIRIRWQRFWSSRRTINRESRRSRKNQKRKKRRRFMYWKCGSRIRRKNARILSW